VDLTTSLTYVKGIGPARAAMLEAKGLAVVEDLLGYVPFRYEDRSNLKTIAQLAPGEMATVMCEVRSAKLSGFRRRNLGLFEARVHRCVARHPGGQMVPRRLPRQRAGRGHARRCSARSSSTATPAS
jgi:RecG-like helicase